jgi:NAD(P)-dependent dehydrogenase (short-subunit alcohol dehydrogenase family)
MNELAGKTVLVTGGARRIGRALALAYARAGADVAVTYRTSASEAEKLAHEIAEMDREAMALRMDVRDVMAVREGMEEVISAFGKLDVLVNNAAVFETAPLEKITPEQWDAMFETNTRGPFVVSQAAYEHLKKSRGRILNIGSLGGLHPWATHAHYCASKAALHMLTQTMAKAWAPEISVNCIAPGMIADGAVEAEYEHFAQKTPMGRNGSTEDVAAAAMFFAMCPAYITGQILGVDGGLAL